MTNFDRLGEDIKKKMRNSWQLKRELAELKLFALALTERIDRLDQLGLNNPLPDLGPSAFIVNLGKAEQAACIHGSIIQTPGDIVYYLEDIHDPFTQTFEQANGRNYFDMDENQVVYNDYLIGSAGSGKSIFYFTGQHGQYVGEVYDVGNPDQSPSVWLTGGRLYVVAGTQYAIVDDFPNTTWEDVQKYSLPDNFATPVVINDYIYGVYWEGDKSLESERKLLQYNLLTKEVTELVLPESIDFDSTESREWIIYSHGQYVINADNTYISIDGTEFVTLDLSDLAADAQAESIVSVPQGFMISIDADANESLYFATDLLDISTYQPITGLPSQISYMNMKVIRQASPNITMVMVDTYLFMFTDDPKLNVQYPPQPIDEPITPSSHSVFLFYIGQVWSGGEGTSLTGEEEVEYMEMSPYYDDMTSIGIEATSTNLGKDFTVDRITRRGLTFMTPEEAGMEFRVICGPDNQNFDKVAWRVDHRLVQWTLTRTSEADTTVEIAVFVKMGPIPRLDE